MSETNKLIYDYLSKQDKMRTLGEIQEALGLSYNICNNAIQNMVATEQLRKSWGAKGVLYEVDWTPVKMRYINTMFTPNREAVAR